MGGGACLSRAAAVGSIIGARPSLRELKSSARRRGRAIRGGRSRVAASGPSPSGELGRRTTTRLLLCRPRQHHQLGCRSSSEAATIFTSTPPWAAAANGQIGPPRLIPAKVKRLTIDRPHGDPTRARRAPVPLTYASCQSTDVLKGGQAEEARAPLAAPQNRWFALDTSCRDA